MSFPTDPLRTGKRRAVLFDGGIANFIRARQYGGLQPPEHVDTLGLGGAAHRDLSTRSRRDRAPGIFTISQSERTDDRLGSRIDALHRFIAMNGNECSVNVTVIDLPNRGVPD